ncbi:MAG: hypothetical protein ACYTGJ_09190 [Planctomycetota bacterium]|jgi:hypothetical protein
MLREWRRRRRLDRRARRLLRGILSDPRNLEGTSLRPAHASRADLIEFEAEGEELRSLSFVLLRHPRPHPFSTQHHLVAERWQVSLSDGPPFRPERLRGLNVSRLKGESDGRPAG